MDRYLEWVHAMEYQDFYEEGGGVPEGTTLYKEFRSKNSLPTFILWRFEFIL